MAIKVLREHRDDRLLVVGCKGRGVRWFLDRYSQGVSPELDLGELTDWAVFSPEVRTVSPFDAGEGPAVAAGVEPIAKSARQTPQESRTYAKLRMVRTPKNVI